ncbi:p2xD [Symbiodinium sp. CCMP2592]|nr:p2xD [Symbiodinium sp. CCMP2592]
MSRRLWAHDWHQACAFSVPLTAVVKDCRLGLAHNMILVSIFMYIVVYQLWYLGGYYRRPLLSMSMRTTLHKPDRTVDTWQVPYCNEASTLCEEFLGEDASFAEPNQLTVITSRLVTNRTLGRNQAAQEIPVKTTLVKDIENFTMKVYPTVFTSSSSSAQDEAILIPPRDLQGLLFVGNVNGLDPPNEVQHGLCRQKSEEGAAFADFFGQRPTEQAPCYVKGDMKPEQSIYQIKTLLEAMGMESHRLDEGEGSSIRMRGMVVVVLVEIENFMPGQGLTRSPRFALKQLPMKKSHHSIDRGSEVTRGDRSAIEYRGLLFVFQVTGTLAHWSLAQLLLQLAKGTSLLSVSAIVMRLLAISLCSRGNLYYHSMHKESPQIEAAEALLHSMEEQTLKEEHRRIFQHHGGSKEQLALRLMSTQQRSPKADVISESDQDSSGTEC